MSAKEARRRVLLGREQTWIGEGGDPEGIASGGPSQVEVGSAAGHANVVLNETPELTLIETSTSVSELTRPRAVERARCGTAGMSERYRRACRAWLE